MKMSVKHEHPIYLGNNLQGTAVACENISKRSGQVYRQYSMLSFCYQK